MYDVCYLFQERELALKKHQEIGIRMDSELPHLVALEDDLLSTGILLYHLKVILVLYSGHSEMQIIKSS